jgi:hypothetical protein
MHRRTMTLYRTVTIDKLTSITARVNVLHLTGLVLQELKFFKDSEKAVVPILLNTTYLKYING